MKLRDLMESPIADIQAIGDFSKAHSFRSAADRKLVTNPTNVKLIEKKFSGVPQTFNLYFVNRVGIARTAEAGMVELDWVSDQIGPDVANAIQKGDPNGITVIFTNNMADEKAPLTPWILAHRLGHAFSSKLMEGPNTAYDDTWFSLIRESAKILVEAYSFSRIEPIIKNPKRLDFQQYSGNPEKTFRANQLMFAAFWESIGTFRSARTGNLREYFEMPNELLAQYITTGHIRFNPLQKVLKAGSSFGGRSTLVLSNDAQVVDEANQQLNMMASDMERGMDAALDYACGRIWVI